MKPYFLLNIRIFLFFEEEWKTLQHCLKLPNLTKKGILITRSYLCIFVWYNTTCYIMFIGSNHFLTRKNYSFGNNLSKPR